MSISSRINEMSSHIEQAYDELQGIGADLTNVNKNIENISMVLDDIYDSMPQVSGEGTNLTLDDTRVGKIKSTLKGNTSQETTTGKNLLPNDTETKTRNGITITKNSDGTYKVNGTATSDVSEAICNSFIPMSGTWRMLGCPSGGSASTYMLSAYVGYWGEGSPNIDTGNGTNITYTGNVKVRFFIKSGTTCNNLIFKPMLTTDTTATIDNFEPYVGGTASPNPNFPQPVNVVSGDNEINVCGRNLFNKDNVSIGYLKEDGTLSADTAYRTSDFMPIRPNTTYYKTSTGSPRTKYFDINKVPLNTTTYWDVPTGGSAGTFTTPNNAYYLRFSFPFTGSSAIDASTIMVKEGTDTTYEPYQGNTYNIDLPEGMELCKIGNYQDYFYKDNGNWYKYGAIGKVVLDGSETYIDNKPRYAIALTGYSNGTFQALCDKFNYINNWQTHTSTNNSFILYKDSAWDIARLSFNYNGVANVNEFKNWLASNNVTVYIPLATPTNTEITYQPLIDQLNELEKAMSKDGQTNISQINNDLGFIIYAEAIKSLENVLDRIELLES